MVDKKYCKRCQGFGQVDTRIIESPVTICNNCNGTGEAQAIPPQRTWVDLTDEQMWNAYTGGSDIINLAYAKSILELFKEKNNG